LLKLKEKVLSHLIFCGSDRKVRDHEEDFHHPHFRIREAQPHRKNTITEMKELRSSRTPRLLGNGTENYGNAAGSSSFPSTFLFTAMLHHHETIVLGDITSEPPGFFDSTCKDIICAKKSMSSSSLS